MALVLLVAACGGPPEPKHPEVREEGQSFRPLTMVPERPMLNVPVGDKEALVEELAEDNRVARRMRVKYGYAEPELPVEEPEVPMEIPDEEQEASE